MNKGKMTYEALWKRLTPLYEAGEAKAVVRWLLDVRFGLSMADILCDKVSELPQAAQAELEAMMARLADGEPVQYVVGQADFCGRQFRVAPGVLIPRPETAELCQWVLEGRGERGEVRGYTLLDIGTGSGCIAITLAAEMPQAEVTGWDISEVALGIARENAERLGVDVSFEQRDILDSSRSTLHASLYDIIVSNPPYIEPREREGMERNVLDYEPHIALFAPEGNPILFYQRIADLAVRALKPGGSLYFELNPLTASSVGNYLTQIGFSRIEIRQDAFGRNRMLKATKI
jgi:release factor glutamine methyltransferase